MDLLSETTVEQTPLEQLRGQVHVHKTPVFERELPFMPIPSHKLTHAL